MFIHWFIYSN